jgi:hypothetical protein
VCTAHHEGWYVSPAGSRRCRACQRLAHRRWVKSHPDYKRKHREAVRHWRREYPDKVREANRRWWERRHPGQVMWRRDAPLLERIARRVRVKHNGCWIWYGARNSSGYGVMKPMGRGDVDRRVHRLVYEIFVGPIPDGAVFHHTCGVKACVNPGHLVLMSTAEHIRLHQSWRKRGKTKM